MDKLQESEADIQFKDGRYVVSLPYKNDIYESLPSDYEMCKGRLISLFCKLRKNPELLRQYDSIFREQLNENIIERVSLEDNEDAHYLPHFGVIREDRETTKLRIVFDGSAKASRDALSLNERLEMGENFMPLLYDTLIRFCTKPIVPTADIEKAFLQIEINEADRNALLFLWYDDVTKDRPSIVSFRYRRLLFGLSCSPALLGKTI